MPSYFAGACRVSVAHCVYRPTKETQRHGRKAHHCTTCISQGPACHVIFVISANRENGRRDGRLSLFFLPCYCLGVGSPPTAEIASLSCHNTVNRHWHIPFFSAVWHSRKGWDHTLAIKESIRYRTMETP